MYCAQKETYGTCVDNLGNKINTCLNLAFSYCWMTFLLVSSHDRLLRRNNNSDSHDLGMYADLLIVLAVLQPVIGRSNPFFFKIRDLVLTHLGPERTEEMVAKCPCIRGLLEVRKVKRIREILSALQNALGQSQVCDPRPTQLAANRLN